jgi:hypothetical protein
MVPSPDQIRDAAYGRWERRGGSHGRDRDDWLRAEQDLLFALNYLVYARIGSGPAAGVGGNGNGHGAARVGEPGLRVCRFCEQTPPRARFSRASGPGPVLRNDGTLILSVPDECDECRQFFEESVEADVQRFARPIRSGWPPGGPLPASLASTPYVPIAAFKGLTRMALACLPRAELAAFEDAIEWVGNAEHDFDAGAFGPLTCDLHVFADPFPAPWATLSLREDDDAPMPYALFHLGDGCGLFQIAVPLCGRDDDLDGRAVIVPHAAPALITGRIDDPIASATVSLTSPRATRETRIVRL